MAKEKEKSGKDEGGKKGKEDGKKGKADDSKKGKAEDSKKDKHDKKEKDKNEKKEKDEDGGKKNEKDRKKKKEEMQKHLFSDVLMKSYLPLRIILMVLGRSPLSQSRQGPSNYKFAATLSSLPGIHFVATTSLLFYILIIGTWNLFVILMDPSGALSQPGPNTRQLLYEKIVIERNLVILIVMWTSVIHSCIASVNILFKREYMANYFSFWTRAVDTMYMDVARGVFRYILIVCCGFLTLVFILFIMVCCRLGPSSVGGPTIMFTLMFRNLISEPWIAVKELLPSGIYKRTQFQIIGGLFFLYVFLSSKVYILLFLFKCKLLRNAFANWNGRVYAAALRGGDFIQSDRGRTTYSLLFKDHCILLDLMEGTDRLFSTIIESYFGLQVVSICFEGYFFIRTVKWGAKQEEAAEDKTFFIRPNDYAPGLIFLVISLLILIVVSKAAAEVGEEALAGLEVIRRKTMLGRRTDEELYFMLSMFASYTAYKKLQLSGGGYFYLDKEFIIGIVSTIFSYFIITYQFQPTLDFTPVKDGIMRCEIGLFLQNFEDLPALHWLSVKNATACTNAQGQPVTSA